MTEEMEGERGIQEYRGYRFKILPRIDGQYDFLVWSADANVNDSDSGKGDGSVARSVAQAIEIGLPLHRDQRFLPVVAVLAGGHDVPASRSAAAPERHDVVHGQRAVPDDAAAVVAHAVRDAPLPPLTRAQLARAFALAPERGGIHGLVELTHAPPAPSRAAPTLA